MVKLFKKSALHLKLMDGLILYIAGCPSGGNMYKIYRYVYKAVFMQLAMNVITECE